MELIGAAKRLLGGLSDEKARWGKQVQEIKRENNELPINVLLAAAFTNYLCDKDENQRDERRKEWESLTKKQRFDYKRFMI